MLRVVALLVVIGSSHAGWGGPPLESFPKYHYEGPTDPTTCRNSKTSGWLTITVDGKDENVTVMSAYPPMLEPQGKSVTVKHNGNGFFAKKCTDDFSADNIATWKLLGKTLSWVTTMDGAGCGCNASPFLTAMPAIGPDGKPNPTKGGTYQCAAPSDPACFEFDTYEANTAGLQTTSHVCSKFDPKTGYMANCTGLAPENSCYYNIIKNGTASAYGNGSNYEINTGTSFWTGVFFINDTTGQNLKQVNIVIAQGSKSIVYRLDADTCPGGATYMKNMGDQMQQRGLGMIVCLWGMGGQRMQWLDKPPCADATACDSSSHVTYSAFEIKSMTPDDVNWLGQF